MILDAFSLSLIATFLQSGLCFRFRPASLPVFYCWVTSSSRFVLVLLLGFMVRRFGGIVPSLLLVCGRVAVVVMVMQWCG